MKLNQHLFPHRATLATWVHIDLWDVDGANPVLILSNSVLTAPIPQYVQRFHQTTIENATLIFVVGMPFMGYLRHLRRPALQSDPRQVAYCSATSWTLVTFGHSYLLAFLASVFYWETVISDFAVSTYVLSQKPEPSFPVAAP